MTNLLVKLPDADGMQVWVFRTTGCRTLFAAGTNYNEAKNLVKSNLYEYEQLLESGRETIAVMIP